MAELPAVPEKPPEAPAPDPSRCANCGTELLGPYCHVCGQSTRHVLKHLPALVEDGLDLVFNIDGRIMRTLPALYLKPGFLAREYLAGRRMRYIPPFRLMFFLSVLAFLVLQFNLNLGGAHINVDVQPSPIHGDTPAQVRASLRKAEAPLLASLARTDLPLLARTALEASDHALRVSANRRLRALGAPPLDGTPAAGADLNLRDSAEAQRYLASIRSAPDDRALAQRLASARAAIDASLAHAAGVPSTRAQLMSLREHLAMAAAERTEALHASTAPAAASTAATTGHVRIPWLPDFLNARIRDGVEHARANLKAMRTGTSASRRKALERIVTESLSVLPQALFLMLPLFAVLLKIVYVFRRRLYIEHLMVAMYSHAFIYLSLLLAGVLGLLEEVSPAWVGSALGWPMFAIFAWMPLYLLLMQKRVYAQGWTMTLVKYLLLGLCYTILVSTAIACAALIGLAS